MGGLNDAEAEPKFLCVIQAYHKGCRTTKTLEFAVLVKKMDSHTVGDSSSFNLGWEEDSLAQAEERPPNSIPGTVNDRSASGLSKPPNHRYLRLRDLWVGVLPHNEPD